MFNWFDLMRQAQTNAALATLAQQFNLSGDQAQKTMAAFMPAFAMGLQHNVANPNATMQLFQLMTGGPYRSFWESAAQAYTPQARKEGIRLLARSLKPRSSCTCGEALAQALITNPEVIPAPTREKLKLLVSKYFK